MKHRTKILTCAFVVAVAIAALSSPAVAFESVSDGNVSYSGVSGAADEVTGTMLGVAGHVTQYSGGRIGIYAYYSDGKQESLQSWADEKESREITAWQNDSNRAHVIAYSHAINGERIWSSGLIDESYIEAVDVEQRVSIPEKIEAVSEQPESYNPRTQGVGAAISKSLQGSNDAEGLAWSNEVNETYLDTARDNLNVSNAKENGTNVTIAVIDTGVNTANGTLGLESSITDSANTLPDNRTDTGLSNVSDGNGHGSWVTSAIAADHSNDTHDGVAPDSDIIAVKALNDEGKGSTQDIVEGVRYAENNGADILSMSLGSPLYNPTMVDAIRNAIENGNVTAAYVAAGNTRANHGLGSPSDGPVNGILSVAATNNENASTAEPAYFSQVGPDDGVSDSAEGLSRGAVPNVSAPGMEITVKVASENGRVENSTLSGTSMATPLAAGSGGLLLEANTSMANETASYVDIVEESAEPIENAGVTEVGHGYVDAARLVNETEASTSQSDARTSEARARDEFNRALGLSTRGRVSRESSVVSLRGIFG